MQGGPSSNNNTMNGDNEEDNNSNEGLAIYNSKVKLHGQSDLVNLESELKKLPTEKNNFVNFEKVDNKLIVTYCYDNTYDLPKQLVWAVKDCPVDNYASKSYCPIIKNKIVWRVRTIKGNIDFLIDRVFAADFKAGAPLNMGKMGLQIRDFIKNYNWHDSPSNGFYLKRITDRFTTKKWNESIIRSCASKLREAIVKFTQGDTEKKKIKFSKWLRESSIPYAYNARNIVMKKLDDITSIVAKTASFFEEMLEYTEENQEEEKAEGEGSILPPEDEEQIQVDEQFKSVEQPQVLEQAPSKPKQSKALKDAIKKREREEEDEENEESNGEDSKEPPRKRIKLNDSTSNKDEKN